MPNTTPINTSAVEELREKIEDLFEGIWDISSEKSAYEFRDKLITRFLAHTSLLSDSTLREVLGEIGEDEGNIPYGSDMWQQKEAILKNSEISITNAERQRIRAIISKKLEK